MNHHETGAPSMSNRTWARRPAAGRGFSRRRLAPMIEAVECRRLMDAGLGYLAGTVYRDTNANGLFDATDAYQSGVTVELYRAGQSTPLATAVTDAHGAYSFPNVAPGQYTLKEVAPAGQTLVGNRVLSDLNPATADPTTRTINVTVVDPAQVVVNYKGVVPNGYVVLNDSVQGQTSGDSAGTLAVSLGTAQNLSNLNPNLLTYCLDDLHRLSFGGGESYSVTPGPISGLTAGSSTTPIDPARAGRIAYLFNHFGDASLSNVQAAGLQLAMWELLYDTGDPGNFGAGDFQVIGPVNPADQGLVDQAVAQAQSYLAQSLGKVETATLLAATSTFTPGALDGYQSVIAHGTLDFLNKDTPPPPPVRASLSGYVYCDAGDDGIKQADDEGIAGVTVTLTGRDVNGQAVTRQTTTDATGFYLFGNLVPGTYTVTETQPAGYVDGKDTQGTPGTGVTGNDVFANIVLPAGVDGRDNNFGEHDPAAAVTGLKLYGIHQQPTAIVLTLDRAVDPVSARNPANYTLIALGHDERLGTADDSRVAISSVDYNQATGTVTIHPARHLNIHYHYVLSMKVAPNEACGTPTSYTAVFGRSSVPVFSAHGVTKPAPRMTPQQIRHSQAVVNRALKVLAGHNAAQGTRVSLAAAHKAAVARF